MGLSNPTPPLVSVLWRFQGQPLFTEHLLCAKCSRRDFIHVFSSIQICWEGCSITPSYGVENGNIETLCSLSYLHSLYVAEPGISKHFLSIDFELGIPCGAEDAKEIKSGPCPQGAPSLSHWQICRITECILMFFV
jgi:hypothetical protein